MVMQQRWNESGHRHAARCKGPLYPYIHHVSAPGSRTTVALHCAALHCAALRYAGLLDGIGLGWAVEGRRIV